MARVSPGFVRFLLIIGVLASWEAFTRITAASPIIIAPPSAVLWQMLKIVTLQSNVPVSTGTLG